MRGLEGRGPCPVGGVHRAGSERGIGMRREMRIVMSRTFVVSTALWAPAGRMQQPQKPR